MTMEGLKLPTSNWVEYFISIALSRDRWLATVELPPLPLNGDDTEPGRRLHAIGYDPNADELEIRVGGGPRRSSPLRYFISAPRAITIEQFRHGKAILVDDASGVRTLIRLFDVRRDRSSATASLGDTRSEAAEQSLREGLSGRAIEAAG
jgi:hypothetical protein